jgi:hypothetical protein
MAPVEAMRPGEDLKRGMQDALDSYRACMEALNFCLQKGGKYAEPKTIRLLTDCAELCRTNADFMVRGSDMYSHTNFACGEVCERTAEVLDRMGDDPVLKACAEACHRCAESDRILSKGIPQIPNVAETNPRVSTKLPT